MSGLMFDARRTHLLHVLFLLAASSACTHSNANVSGESNSARPEGMQIANFADDEDLVFKPIEAFAVDAAYIWSNRSGGYVASFAMTDQPNCFDLIAANETLLSDLARLDQYPATQNVPPILNFRLTMNAVAQIPSSRASYQYWEGESNPLISSSAWYYRGGQQVFLNCPVSTFEWRVYRVTAIEQLTHSPAE